MSERLIQRLRDTAAERARAVADKDNQYLSVVARISHSDALLMEEAATALANAEREGMRRGYLLGFNASGEGWNGEYPFQDQARSPESSLEWVVHRDRTLSELDNPQEESEGCPVCGGSFDPADLCATDIELGICHAECLEGCPVVDLETGEPSDGPVATYRYCELDNPQERED